MTVPPPSPGPVGPGGTAAVRPADVAAFARRVDALSQGVTEAHEALRRLSDAPLPVGSGDDNRAIAGWYRDLLVGDTAPAAAALATDLDTVRRAVRESAAAWEQADRGAAGYLRADPGPT